MLRVPVLAAQSFVLALLLWDVISVARSPHLMKPTNVEFALRGSVVRAVLAVLYARVSSKEQEQEGFSIPAQLKLLREYAVRTGFQIVREFVDVETAKNPGREQFGNMLKFLQGSSEVGVILVEKTDRLYRNFRDLVYLEEIGASIHLVKENRVVGKDSRSSEKFQHGIMVLLAKHYIDNLSEETKKGMQEKAEQGHYPSFAPLGYRNNLLTHTIEPDPERAPMIRRAFEIYATGACSLSVLRKTLIAEGLGYRKSGKAICKGTLAHLLKSPIYYGNFVWNGKRYRGKHEPLVSRELFDSVQRAIHRTGKQKMTKRGFPYTGLLICGHCGCTITAEIKKSRYVYYHCTKSKGNCPGIYLRQEDIERELTDLLKLIKIPETTVGWIKDALRLSHAQERIFHADALESLNARHKKLQNLLDQAYQDKLEGIITAEYWRTKSADWQAEQETILSRMRNHHAANKDYFDHGAKILELAERAHYLFVRQNADEKRKLLNIVLSNCTLTGGTLSPTWNLPFNLIAQGVETKDWLPGQDSNLQPFG